MILCLDYATEIEMVPMYEHVLVFTIIDPLVELYGAFA